MKKVKQEYIEKEAAKRAVLHGAHLYPVEYDAIFEAIDAIPAVTGLPKNTNSDRITDENGQHQ